MWDPSYTGEDELSTLVLDLGSSKCKAGFAGDDGPQSVFSSVVGRNRIAGNEASAGKQEAYVGYDVQETKAALSITHPIEHGIVTNWDDMEILLNYIFNKELRVSPSDYSILVTEPPLNPKSNREIMTQNMFEKYEVPAYYMILQSILTQYSCGRVSSIMVEVGGGITHILPIYEGHAILPAVKRRDFAGRDLTNYLQELLNHKGYSFCTYREQEIVRDIKEQCCYVASDYEQEMLDPTACKEKSYELPDGTKITLDNERIACPETLFQPHLFGHQEKGLVDLIYQSLMDSDIDARLDLFCNVILSGGTTLLPGFHERLLKELDELIPKRRTKVIASPERQYHVWIGGSILGSMTTFRQMWITKQEYEEHGPNIIHKRCAL
ncbi:hypothetical protein LOTGIDRAFT_155589 [Lottia gigantea]|uniref:Actin, cytoplasmic n=1 Tax=Lottia gigantea TaxID=225164 RepID=V4B6R7_LOTGI|nr:hypothetical protein LOTGIDRAFT_155589 [Lottia gigantea]ESO84254.1 hypothetical protein LOTGIDRAFT_155589 [Lottia gigantea]